MYKRQILVICGLILLRIVCVIIVHFVGEESFFGYINSIYAYIGGFINPQEIINMRDMDIGMASLLIVALMLLLMMTGMPLGIVTLFVSILSALFYFGYGGLYLVSTNAFGLLEKYYI